MVCPCCVLCSPCNECSWPASRFEFGETTLECAGAVGAPSSRGQDIYQFGTTLPDGVTWKAGFPDALSGCNWALVRDSLFIDCCYDNCTVNGVPGSLLIAGQAKYRYRLMVLNCPTEDDPSSVSDITVRALDGNLLQETSQAEEFCVGDPVACTEWFEFFNDPAPVCNEFP